MPEDVDTKTSHEKNAKAPDGAAAGGGAGLVLGGTLGWLAGIGAVRCQDWERLCQQDPLWRRWRLSAWIQPSEVLRED